LIIYFKKEFTVGFNGAKEENLKTCGGETEAKVEEKVEE